MEKKKIEKEEIKKKTGGRKGLCLFENNNLITEVIITSISILK